MALGFTLQDAMDDGRRDLLHAEGRWQEGSGEEGLGPRGSEGMQGRRLFQESWAPKEGHPIRRVVLGRQYVLGSLQDCGHKAFADEIGKVAVKIEEDELDFFLEFLLS